MESSKNAKQQCCKSSGDTAIPEHCVDMTIPNANCITEDNETLWTYCSLFQRTYRRCRCPKQISIACRIEVLLINLVLCIMRKMNYRIASEGMEKEILETKTLLLKWYDIFAFKSLIDMLNWKYSQVLDTLILPQGSFSKVSPVLLPGIDLGKLTSIQN